MAFLSFQHPLLSNANANTILKWIPWEIISSVVAAVVRLFAVIINWSGSSGKSPSKLASKVLQLSEPSTILILRIRASRRVIASLWITDDASVEKTHILLFTVWSSCYLKLFFELVVIPADSVGSFRCVAIVQEATTIK
jgi:hypothetical protein